MDRARLGVIGTGFIGEIHLRALLELREVELAAICDADASRLRSIGEQYGIAQRYQDAAQMLDQQDLDGVIIATPDDAHRGPVEVAANAGVDILLEKPIATTLADAQAIVDMVEDAGVKLQIGFTLRYSPSFQDFHRRLEEGWFGTLTTGHTRRACPVREARRLGGRVTANQYLGIHDIDLLLWFFGPGLKQVYAHRGDFLVYSEIGVADYYWTFLTWENGASAAVYATWAVPDGTPNYVETELLLNGTRAAAHFDWKGQVVRLFDEDSFVTQEAFPNIYQIQDQAFVDAITQDRTPTPDGTDGINALRVILAAEESAQTGMPVSIDLRQQS